MVTTASAEEQQQPLGARVRMGAGGRLVIPAEIRRELGLNEGEPVILQVEDGSLRLWTLREAIRRAQEAMRPYRVPGRSLVDEFIADRRAEAARE